MWQRLGNIFKSHWAQVPVAVHLEKDIYRIFYSRRIKGKSYPYYIEFDVCKKIITKNPVGPILKLGRRGSFDWAGIMPTEIVNFKNRSFLYYIGWSRREDVPYHNNLGLAVSRPRSNLWKKYSEGPIFSTSRHEPGYIGTIGIIRSQKKFFGLYLACRKWKKIKKRIEPIYDLKIATSKNGLDWAPIKNGLRLLAGEGGLSKASIIKLGKKFYVWFSSRAAKDYRNNPKNGYKIICATSKNIFSWRRIKKYEIKCEKKHKNETKMVAYPHVIKHKKILYMFYNGNEFGKTGIFLAKMEAKIQ